MAVYLDPASNGRVDYGDLTVTDDISGITVAITFTPLAAMSTGERLITKWGNTAAERSFVLQCRDTDEVGFAVGDNGSLFGEVTTGLDMQVGQTYTIVAKWTSGSIKFFVNGREEADGAWIADAGPTAIHPSTSSIQVGHETDEASDGPDGNFARFAIWNDDLPDAICRNYSTGKVDSLDVLPSKLVLYDPLKEAGSFDVVGGVVPTWTGATTVVENTYDPNGPILAGNTQRRYFGGAVVRNGFIQ